MLGHAVFCICRVKRIDESRLFEHLDLLVSIVTICLASVPIVWQRGEERRRNLMHFTEIEAGFERNETATRGEGLHGNRFICRTIE